MLLSAGGEGEAHHAALLQIRRPVYEDGEGIVGGIGVAHTVPVAVRAGKLLHRGNGAGDRSTGAVVGDRDLLAWLEIVFFQLADCSLDVEPAAAGDLDQRCLVQPGVLLGKEGHHLTVKFCTHRAVIDLPEHELVLGLGHLHIQLRLTDDLLLLPAHLRQLPGGVDAAVVRRFRLGGLGGQLFGVEAVVIDDGLEEAEADAAALLKADTKPLPEGGGGQNPVTAGDLEHNVQGLGEGNRGRRRIAALRSTAAALRGRVSTFGRCIPILGGRITAGIPIRKGLRQEVPGEGGGAGSDCSSRSGRCGCRSSRHCGGRGGWNGSGFGGRSSGGFRGCGSGCLCGGFGSRLRGGLRRCFRGRFGGWFGLRGLVLPFLAEGTDLLPDLLEQGGVDVAVAILGSAEPADYGPLLAAAVVLFRERYRAHILTDFHAAADGAPILLTGRLGDDFGNAHGRHVPKLRQTPDSGVQIQLLFLHRQTLAFQLQLGQGGVEAHQNVPLLHAVSLLHPNLCYNLGVGEEDGLNPVGGDGAVGLLGISPELGHADVLKAVNGNRLAPDTADQKEPCPEGNAQQDGNARNQKAFGFSLLRRGVKSHGCLPPPRGAHHPECGRACGRSLQWPARG